MRHLIIISLCFRLLGDLAYKLHIVQDVKTEEWDESLKDYIPTELYPLGTKARDVPKLKEDARK